MRKCYLSKAQILSRLTIALRARSPDAIPPGVIASVSEAIQEKDRATECAMTGSCISCRSHVIAEGEACPRSMDCFVAKHRIIRVVAGVTSGSNLLAGALRATAPYRKSELAMTGNLLMEYLEKQIPEIDLDLIFQSVYISGLPQNKVWIF